MRIESVVVAVFLFSGLMGGSAGASDPPPRHWELVRKGLVSSKPCRFTAWSKPFQELSQPQADSKLRQAYEQCGRDLQALVQGAGSSTEGDGTIEVRSQACARIDQELIDRCAAQCAEEPEPLSVCLAETARGKPYFDPSRLDPQERQLDVPEVSSRGLSSRKKPSSPRRGQSSNPGSGSGSAK